MNGTTYHPETPKSMQQLLERVRQNNWRIRLHYGDVQTGEDWGDVYDVTGTLGRSMGPIKVPILLPNARSMGGAAILDACIVRLRFANKKNGGDLYCHSNYHERREAA